MGAEEVIKVFSVLQRGDQSYPEDCDWMYNKLEYDKRGWCTFESGAASVVVALLRNSDQKGQFQRRCKGRPKLVEIGAFMNPTSKFPPSAKTLDRLELRAVDAVFKDTVTKLHNSKFN